MSDGAFVACLAIFGGMFLAALLAMRFAAWLSARD